MGISWVFNGEDIGGKYQGLRRYDVVKVV